MTVLTPTHRSFTAHQRLQALERVANHPFLDDCDRAALRTLWTSLWQEKARGRLLWSEEFKRREVGGEHWSDALPLVGLGTLVDAWRAVAGLAPIEAYELDNPTHTLAVASSILIPLETVLETVGIESTCAWFPPDDWWREGHLVFLLRKPG